MRSAVGILAISALQVWLGMPGALAQSREVKDLGVGKLLVAPRDAPDPAFAETVILIVNYDANGAVGLMLNRKTTVPVARVLPDLKNSGKREDSMYMGGPVEIEGVMILFRSEAKEAATHLFNKLYLATSKEGLDEAVGRQKKDARDFRFYAGYCGWSPGQLEHELKLGGWYILDRSEDAVFDTHPDTLWSRLIEKAEVEFVFLTGNPYRPTARSSF